MSDHHVPTDREPSDLSFEELRREWSEVVEALRGPPGDEARHNALVDRRDDLWMEMRDRTDADPPACPECDGTLWGQSIGNPKRCRACGYSPSLEDEDLIAAIDDYWASVKAIPDTERDPETDADPTEEPA